jgi:hypothetical protein
MAKFLFENVFTQYQSKWRKTKKDLEIEMAQEESKARAQKKRMVKEPNVDQPTQVYKIQACIHEEELEEDTPLSIINVQLGEERRVTQAFNDSGVNCNTISYKLLQQLGGYELQETQVLIKSFSGHCIQVQGSCVLSLFVDEVMCEDKFIVTQSCI